MANQYKLKLEYKDYENDTFLYVLDSKIRMKHEQILSDCSYYQDKFSTIKLRLENYDLSKDYVGLNSLGELQNAGKFDIMVAELELLIDLKKEYLASKKYDAERKK